MKRYRLFTGLFILVAFCSFSSLNAQETTPEEEKELQEAINEQKREMIEQQKAVDEAKKELEKAIIIQKELEDKSLKEVQEHMKKIDDPEFRRIIEGYRDAGRSGSFPGPFMFTPGQWDFNHQFSNGNSERTTWDFSRSLKESSFSRDYSFDVEPTAKSMVLSVSGDCKEGEIRVRIKMPGGRTFSEIVIDEFGDLNWRKTLTISETENQDKTGEWTFEIKSTNATGYFKIFFQVS